MTRAAGRRRLRRLLLVVALAVAVGAAGFAIWSPVLDVDRVVVVGAGERAAEVRAAVGVERGEPLLLVATGSVDHRVEALGWVDRASVTRELPGTLRVVVTQSAPVAYAVRPDGQVALVDATATVTGLGATAPGGLPALVTTAPPPGPGGKVHPAGAAVVAGRLGPLAGRVARISVEGARAALLLADGREVHLGDRAHVGEKARAAVAVLDAPGLPAFAYVDVSVPGAPVTGG